MPLLSAEASRPRQRHSWPRSAPRPCASLWRRRRLVWWHRWAQGCFAALAAPPRHSALLRWVSRAAYRALTRAVARSRRRAPARAAAGGEAAGSAWPSAEELRRGSGAPDADKHFDVTGVVVAPSFRASRSFLGAPLSRRDKARPNCQAQPTDMAVFVSARLRRPAAARARTRHTRRALTRRGRALQRRRRRRRRAAWTRGPCACCCCRRATSAAPSSRRPCCGSASRSAAWATSCASSQKVRAALLGSRPVY